jgi:2'-5' RNA ligase
MNLCFYELDVDNLSNVLVICSDITQGDKVVVRLRGLEIMNDDPTQVDVLYAKCQSENRQLQDIADLVASSFAESGEDF